MDTMQSLVRLKNQFQVKKTSPYSLRAKQEDYLLPSKQMLLSLASLHGQLRHVPQIWQIIINDLSQKQHLTMTELANKIDVSTRTLKRLVASETMRPSLSTGLRLLLLHMQLCPAWYRKHLGLPKKTQH